MIDREPDTEPTDREFIVIGGGPAGLTAAFELTKRSIPTTVVEKAGIVGGLSRTEQYKGYRFDMGGHRFYTKSAEVNELWDEILGQELLIRERMSRIYYRSKFFDYPLKPLNALGGLGIVEAIRVGCSYLYWSLFPSREEKTFEQWTTNRFGKRLFEIFFKTYTEKVWGISCSELQSEWAEQRIKNLTLKVALVNMFIRRKNVTSLIERFKYPRLGPGMMWEAARQVVEHGTGRVLMESDVVAVHRQGNTITGITIDGPRGQQRIEGTDLISSMPIGELICKLDPPPPADVVRAARSLKHRDFVTVAVIVTKHDLFADNWIYIHDPNVKVGRIQNYANWSPDMVPEGGYSLGLEYFCHEGDELWNRSDQEMLQQAARELVQLGLLDHEAQVVDGCVCRIAKSYPIYDAEYADDLGILKDYVRNLANLQTIGRNGLHRYNNQDHAMLTGLYAVRNMLGESQVDLWQINAEQEYLEEVVEDLEVPEEDVEELIDMVFAKIHNVSLGLSLGVVCGVVLCACTLLLSWRSDLELASYFELLSHYYPGYRVSAMGSLLGLVYGFGSGFLVGWLLAIIRNFVSYLYFVITQRSYERRFVLRFLEHL